jgi:hypothetical protein
MGLLQYRLTKALVKQNGLISPLSKGDEGGCKNRAMSNINNP